MYKKTLRQENVSNIRHYVVMVTSMNHRGLVPKIYGRRLCSFFSLLGNVFATKTSNPALWCVTRTRPKRT